MLSSAMEIERFVQNLPKVELHIHIEGTLTPELRWALAQKNSVDLPFQSLEDLKSTYTTWDNDYRQKRLGAAGLSVFLEQYFGGMIVLRTSSDFYELARDYLRKAASMNVRHAEVFFDPQAHTRRGVPIEAVMQGLERAKREAFEESGLTCSYILCFLRDMSAESAEETYNECLPFGHRVFNGIGLDGNEHDRPPNLFEAIFRRAREDGFKLTSHCDVGQKNTHEHIHQVVSSIVDTGLDRIDHGLSAADKPELIAAIKHRGLGMTLCPHAYYRRWSDEDVFPVIRRLFDEGVKITINSDDPTYMHFMYIVENMQLVKDRCNFTEAEMVQLVRNSIEVCWASDQREKELGENLARFVQDWKNV